MLKQVDAILWRSCNKAAFDSLNGHSRGQYDIRLSRMDFEPFFVGLRRSNKTDNGGFDIVVPIEPYTGSNAVGPETLVFHYMGQNSARKDWIISSQRPETAYPLWRPGRGVGEAYEGDYVLIARDVDRKFHARWLKSAAINHLPSAVQAKLRSDEVGWGNLT